MPPTRLLRLFPLVLPIPVAIAVSVQAPAATRSGKAGDLRVLANQAITQMVAPKLREEIILTKIQTSQTNTELSNPAPVEPKDDGVSASVITFVMTLKSSRPRGGSDQSVRKEGT